MFLEVGAGLNVVVLSLDDFYLTRDERNALARTVHPMLQVRGVPGTHDIQFASATIKSLLQEQKLIDLKGTSGSGVMNQDQVQRFIQHYERLTRHNLAEMPSRADLVYHINNGHGIDDATSSWSEATF